MHPGTAETTHQNTDDGAAPGVRGVWELHLFRKELERLLGLYVQRQPHLGLLLQVFYMALDFRKLAEPRVQRSRIGVVRKGRARDGRCGDQVRWRQGTRPVSRAAWSTFVQFYGGTAAARAPNSPFSMSGPAALT